MKPRGARGALVASLLAVLLLAPLVLGLPGSLPDLLVERVVDAELPAPPSVRLVSPRDGQGVGGSVILAGEARAGHLGDPVVDVQYRIDGGRWESIPDVQRGVPLAGFEVALALEPGDHVVEARASDGEAYSLPARVIVRAGAAGAPPTVRILQPADGAGVARGSVDVVGTVEGPGPFRVLVGEPGQEAEARIVAEDARGALFAASVTLDDGLRTILARAAGATGESLPARVVVAVNATPPPALALLAPENGTSFGTAGSGLCDGRCIDVRGASAGATPLADVLVAIDHQEPRSILLTPGASIDPVSGAWAFPLATDPLFDGPHRVAFTPVGADGAPGAPRAIEIGMRAGRALAILGDDAPAFTGTTLRFRAEGSGLRDVQWSLDGARIADGEEVALALGVPGDHVLVAEARDLQGRGATARLPLFAKNRAPEAFPFAGASGVATQPVRFEARAEDPDGAVVRYAWTFGDGLSTTTEAPTVDHRFARPGVYTVAVVALDELGAASAPATTTAFIANHPPVAEFAWGPTQATLLDDVAFEDLSFDPDGRVVAWSWDFGDGSPVVTDRDPTHRFRTRGEHAVRLVVVDADGGVGVATERVVVANLPARVGFGFLPELPETKQEILFFDSSEKDDGAIVEWRWDFGDGTNGTGVFARHAYDAPGRYDVTLTTVDDWGDLATRTLTVEVADAGPLVRGIVAEPETPSAMDAVRFRALATDVEGELARVEWDFGDGTSSRDAEPVHRFARSGAYNVSVVVFDAAGQRGAANLTLVVRNLPPVAELANLDAPYAGLPATILARVADADGRIQRIVFELDGDGVPDCDGAEESCVFIFPAPGTYRLQLSVTDDEGESVVVERDLIVLPPPAGLVPPRVAIDLPDAGATVRGEFQARGRAHGIAPIARVEAQLRNETWTFASARGAWVPAQGTTDWLVHVDTRVVPDGAYVLAVRATDASGSWNESLVPLVVQNGGSAGAVEVVLANLEPGQALTSDTTVRGAAWHPAGITSIRWRIDDGPWRLAEGESGAFLVPLSPRGLAPGEHVLVVDAYHGLADRASLAVPFVVPDQRPFFAVDAAPGPVAYAKMRAEGRVSQGARVYWRVDNDLWRAATGGEAWTIDESTKAWRGGPHLVTLKAVDEDSGAQSDPVTFHVRFLNGEVREKPLRTQAVRYESPVDPLLALGALAVAALGFGAARRRL